jgi:hypothetical protein
MPSALSPHGDDPDVTPAAAIGSQRRYGAGLGTATPTHRSKRPSIPIEDPA